MPSVYASGLYEPQSHHLTTVVSPEQPWTPNSGGVTDPEDGLRVRRASFRFSLNEPESEPSAAYMGLR